MAKLKRGSRSAAANKPTPSTDSSLGYCVGRVYDDLFEKGLQPAREDLVRDDESVDALISTVRQIWVEECGGCPASFPWNRGYVLKKYIAYRKETRQANGELRKPATLFPSAAGIVYFIRNSRGHIKIGWTGRDDPYARISELQTGESERLEVAACIDGPEHLERSLHFRFAQYRIRRNGEWFYSCDELKALIEENRCQ
jgi:hypothetical protein